MGGRVPESLPSKPALSLHVHPVRASSAHAAACPGCLFLSKQLTKSPIMHTLSQLAQPPELPAARHAPSRLAAARASDASSPVRPVFALGDPASASSLSTNPLFAEPSEPPTSTFPLAFERQPQSLGPFGNQSDDVYDRQLLLQLSQSHLAADVSAQINGLGEAGCSREVPSRVTHERSVSQTDIVALRNFATSTSNSSIWSANHVPPLDQSTSPASTTKMWKPSASSSVDLFRVSAAPISSFVRRTGSLLDVKSHSKLPFPQYQQQQHLMADFSRLVQKGKHDISSLDLIDDVGTLFSFDEDSPDGGTVNIDYSSSDRNNRTSSLDGSQESNSDAYTWVGSFSDAQVCLLVFDICYLKIAKLPDTTKECRIQVEKPNLWCNQ
ncbi:hypothetical protein HDU83_009157 [Entophlyctis luteolus]|nr:hypothetical protein HDU83_009157 [Entophlyctis luteolus]